MNSAHAARARGAAVATRTVAVRFVPSFRRSFRRNVCVARVVRPPGFEPGLPAVSEVSFLGSRSHRPGWTTAAQSKDKMLNRAI